MENSKKQWQKVPGKKEFRMLAKLCLVFHCFSLFLLWFFIGFSMVLIGSSLVCSLTCLWFSIIFICCSLLFIVFFIGFLWFFCCFSLVLSWFSFVFQRFLWFSCLVVLLIFFIYCSIVFLWFFFGYQWFFIIDLWVFAIC